VEDFGGEWKEIKLLPEDEEEETVSGLVRPLNRDEDEEEADGKKKKPSRSESAV